ncbi:MAG: hypothetical protein ABTS16_20165 [Candidatus Accumulibacter phosphatis]|jgi:hypothetical protein
MLALQETKAMPAQWLWRADSASPGLTEPVWTGETPGQRMPVPGREPQRLAGSLKNTVFGAKIRGVLISSTWHSSSTCSSRLIETTGSAASSLFNHMRITDPFPSIDSEQALP